LTSKRPVPLAVSTGRDRMQLFATKSTALQSRPQGFETYVRIHPDC